MRSKNLYISTFYWEGKIVKTIKRTNKKHLFSASHRWSSNSVQKWDEIIIERKKNGK